MPVKFTHLDTRKVDTTESFFSDQFLKARINSGRESNEGFDPIFEEGRDEKWMQEHWKENRENEFKYDEDINQYLTLTLAELVNPQTLSFLNAYMIDINSDVGQIAVTLEENSKKYFIYKINADFLLLNLGLFNKDSNLLGRAYFDKGESYYFSAACSLKAMKGGRSGLSDVLEKLANGFGKYVEILRSMKNASDNYMSFHYRIPKAELVQLEHTITQEVLARKDLGLNP